MNNNNESLKKYLVDTQDYTSFADHVKRYHPNGLKEGDSCKFKEELEKQDKVDTNLAKSNYLKLAKEDETGSNKQMINAAKKMIWKELVDQYDEELQDTIQEEDLPDEDLDRIINNALKKDSSIDHEDSLYDAIIDDCVNVARENHSVSDEYKSIQSARRHGEPKYDYYGAPNY